MRLLVPAPDALDPVDAYGRLGRVEPRRPGVRLNMIATVDGGPVVAAELAAAGLLDELCLTVSPLLAGGDAHRILAGSPRAPPLRPERSHVLEADGHLFLRYRRR